jgi:serine/threonine-protein kinase
MLGRWDFMPKREVLPRAKAAAQKALEIDESLAEAHTSLGLYHQTVWNWAACEKELKRALELSPSYASANHWYGDTLSMIGRHNEAILWSQRALELDPLSPMINTTLARAFYLARQYDRCIAQGQNTVRLFPEFVASYWVLGGCYVEKGMPGEAIAVFEKARSLLGARPEEVAAMKQASARDGLRGYYLWLLEDLKEESKRKYVSPWLFAMTYGQLNEKEQALAWLEKAYEERNYGMTSLKVDPIYDPLRDDPRFQSLLRRMNLLE